MPDHPIESLMETAMESIKDMVDVNTVVGDAVETPDGTVIIPISRVTFGFAAGGADYGTGEEKDSFGGGSGAGVSVSPVGFMVVGNGQVRFLATEGPAVLDRVLDLAPQLMDRVQSLFHKNQEEESPEDSQNRPPV